MIEYDAHRVCEAGAVIEGLEDIGTQYSTYARYLGIPKTLGQHTDRLQGPYYDPALALL